MHLHHIALPLRHSLRLNAILQVAVLALFWQAGEAVVHIAKLPVPGAVVGLVFVLGLLASGRLKLASVRSGARWLLAEMLLFFIPAVLAVLDHREFFGLLGLKILLVIVVGAATVMIATALAVDVSYRIMIAMEDRRHAPSH
jgi:holin-like protein